MPGKTVAAFGVTCCAPVPGLVGAGGNSGGLVDAACAKGAALQDPALQDPARHFNASMDGKARRVIDIHEGEAAFKALIAQAVALNSAGKLKSAKKVKS